LLYYNDSHIYARRNIKLLIVNGFSALLPLESANPNRRLVDHQGLCCRTMKLMSVDQAAEALGLSRRSTTRLIETGQLRAYRISGFTIRIDEDDILAMLNAQVIEPIHPKPEPVKSPAKRGKTRRKTA
jgi:excisionase family DNA binding protein